MIQGIPQYVTKDLRRLSSIHSLDGFFFTYTSSLNIGNYFRTQAHFIQDEINQTQILQHNHNRVSYHHVDSCMQLKQIKVCFEIDGKECLVKGILMKFANYRFPEVTSEVRSPSYVDD